jgi:uncharacterized protein (TIGR03435 family)
MSSRFLNFFALGLLALGQAEPSFEAASVKPLKAADGSPVHVTVLPTRLDIRNMNLQFLIKWAYDLRDDQVSGPDWLRNHRYDVVATTEAPVSQAAMRTMLQHLLAERFQLATHWQTNTTASYHLVVLPKGPKMKTAEHGYDLPNSPMVNKGAVQLNGPMSMPQLAERLTRYAGKPVVDATNLDGYFTIMLTFASTDVASPSDTEFAPPLLASAIQEQLGLKLIPASEPIKTLVIDHAEAVPTSN